MDELNEYLLLNYDNYVSGRRDCNLLIWGTDENEKQVPKLCTLIVGIEYDPLISTKEQITELLNSRFSNDMHFKNMYKFGDEIASRGSVQYAVIGFPALRNQYENRWEESINEYSLGEVLFYLHELPSKRGRLILGNELRKYIYDVLGETYTDTGTAKRKNKSIADYFQFWSRSFLSRHLVKLDIDGIFAKEEAGVIIEIKRSNKPPIPKWEPYRADYPDFALLKAFSDTLGMKFTILHHTGMNACNDNTVISLFEVDEFMGTSTDISYSKQELEMKLKAENGLSDYLIQYS